MIIPKKIFLFLFAALLLLSSCTTKYYVVRHADKDTASGFLTTTGELRAEALKDTLLSKNIDSVFVTNIQRTQQTAQPLVNALNETPVILPANNTPQLIAALNGIRGKNVLVVGHSNTVPLIVDGLMATPQNIAIPENDYDNLFIVKVQRTIFSPNPSRTLTRTTYGATSP